MIAEFAIAFAMSVHLHTKNRDTALIHRLLHRDDVGLFHMPGKAVDQDTERSFDRFIRPVELRMKPDAVATDKEFFHMRFLQILQAVLHLLYRKTGLFCAVADKKQEKDVI